MFELYFTGLKYCDQAKRFRSTGHYQMSKSSMTPGTSSMLRARRRDVTAKPNRVLDKSSSRGMIYENEELRLRTININAEVEKGQHDIKKLRRENDQLRREIWTLREEYDRLESLLKKRQLSEEEGENSEGEEEEDDEEEEEKQTEEDQDEENGQREIDKTKLHPKVEFDELSVVEEEPEELSNEDERHHRSEERIEHPEERHNRCEVEEPERIEPERPVTVPDIQISNVDGDGSSGVEGRKDGGCSGGQNCPGVERPIETNSNHPEIPERIPSRMNEDIHPHPTISKLRSDSLHKQNSIHPFDHDPTGPKPSQGYCCPSNQRDDPKPHQGCCQRADPSVAKSTEVRQPVYISPVASVRPIVSDVLVDDAKVFQTLYNRRAVLRHNIPARPQHLSKVSCY
ncbi:hypothetical protein M8J75_005237 [Diaphorina citri]|nr:hypothetical protein M8J75_005237 [Diaphorina citri]